MHINEAVHINEVLKIMFTLGYKYLHPLCFSLFNIFTMMMTQYTALFASLFVFIYLFFLKIEYRKRKHLPLPPGPIRWPVLGSIVTLWLNRPYFRWMLRICDGNDITCVRLGNTYVVVVNSPKIALEFLKNNDALFASRPRIMSSEHTGRGHYLSVVIAPFGEQWKKMRKIMANVLLSPAKLSKDVKLRTEEADHLVSFIYDQLDKNNNIINVRWMARYYSGNLIRKMLFGRRWFRENLSDVETMHVETSLEIVSLIFSFCTNDHIPLLRWLDIEGYESRVIRKLKIMNSCHDPIIDARLKMWESGEKKKVEDALDAFITLKDRDGKPMLTLEEIKAQCAEVVYATLDNPSNFLEWGLAHLIDQPEIYKRAVEEIDRVVGKDRLVQESDFAKLPYIRAIAREVGRLHPVAAFNVPHVSISDATVSGYFIPKGTHVLLSRIGLGRNPKVWADPLKFDPERHMQGELDQITMVEPELKFISFTRGRRGCMGYELGTLMTYMLIARFIQAFEWSLPPGVDKLDFLEEENSLFRRHPLYACAKPRLPPHVFKDIGCQSMV